MAGFPCHCHWFLLCKELALGSPPKLHKDTCSWSWNLWHVPSVCVGGAPAPCQAVEQRNGQDDCCPRADIIVARQTVHTEERLEGVRRGNLYGTLHSLGSLGCLSSPPTSHWAQRCCSFHVGVNQWPLPARLLVWVLFAE